MSKAVVVGLVLIIAGFLLAWLFTAIKESGDAIGWLLVAVLVGFGITLNVGVTVKNTSEVNKMYAAASKQGLTITTSAWEQTPSATEPCKVKLRYDKKEEQLFLAGADTVATPEVLTAICK